MNIFKFGFWPSILVLVFLLIILGAAAAAVGKWEFNKKIDSELKKLKQQNSTASDFNNQKITVEDLRKLPEPVNKWLKHTGVIGKKRISAVNLKQSGEMKLEPDQKKWFKPEAEQFIAVNEPGFLWQVDLSMLPVIKTRGRDLFKQGNASMLIKIAYLLPVVNQEANAKINESALHRFLLELPWYPTAALNNYISWGEIDATTARATINHQGVQASADFIFDQRGNLLRTEALRYKESSEGAERLKCTGELKEYKEFDGIKIPTKIDVSWYLDSGKFTWFKVKIEEINFKY
ncbi:DUF6920 family protein [Halanaerobium kushneri]|uniref:Uncharacterized protein n=1 Tax=Halanaerobium kushneri TaxID=56779 RepID=A0A1N6SXZ8_9FIRM|nr:DUF6544 family protein [Halanaerobium kushneri]SIQ45998.1 hypothetical protein SAMN05421834_104176 [Halanaerobium kushneri]